VELQPGRKTDSVIYKGYFRTTRWFGKDEVFVVHSGAGYLVGRAQQIYHSRGWVILHVPAYSPILKENRQQLC